MASLNFFDCFYEDIAEKVHNLGSDQLVIALSASAPTVATDDELADISQIAYTNLSSRNITTFASSQAAGTYKLVLTDLVLSASGGGVAAFRYIIIYNDTAVNDELIGYYDYGSSLTLANGESLTIDFDAANGVLQLS